MKIKGKIYSRSSKKSKGPPGEKELLMLNPQRKERILAETGWKDLYEGSLNLKVKEKDVYNLLAYNPLFVETDVKYPEKYANIIKKRVGYLYYLCYVVKDKRKHIALIRRAFNPCKECLELFSYERLRDWGNWKDGDKIKVLIPEYVR